MSKIRIAVFGISDGILGALQEKINPKKAEIVLFIDNDKTKQELCYRNIPVVPPSKQLFDQYAVDAYLITALSHYEDVRKQLMGLGVSKEKIQVFFAEDIDKFCVGPMGDIDEDFIRQVYFEPGRIMETARRYQEIYNKYTEISVYEDDMEAWFHKSSLISHACGGIVNQRRAMYTNSKEAFSYSIQKGFKLLECDVLLVSDDELVLGHDYKCFYESEQEQYTMMTIKELLDGLKQQAETYCLIDVKWENHEEYHIALNKIDRTIDEIAVDEKEASKLKKQVVMEVYDEETIKMAKEKNFEMIFTQYKNPDWQCFMNTVVLCYQYGIRAIALAIGSCFLMEKFMKIITDKGIKVFAFSTDSFDGYSALKRIGVTGIFTNYLTENDMI